MTTREDTVERFRHWIADQCGTQHEAARRLLTSPSMVAKIVSGERRPGADLRFSIQSATALWPEGPIDARDWSPIEGSGVVGAA